LTTRKSRVDAQRKSNTYSKESKANFGENYEYIYVVRAKLKPESESLVRRESWKGKYRTVVRDDRGRFITSTKYTRKSHHTAQREYGTSYRTLTIHSKQKFDMKNRREREIVFDAIETKYKQDSKYAGYRFQRSSFDYRYTFRGTTGEKV